MAANIIGLATLVLVLNGSVAWASDGSERVTLLLRLVDYARVHGPVLHAAKDQMTRIFAAAGVSVAWTTDAAEPRAVDVLVLSHSMSDRVIKLESLPAGVLGLAIRPVNRAYILTERVTDLASRLGVDPGDALGDVMAHELGHLLLGEIGHSATGIMEADYAIRNRVSRRFTDAEAARIREHLMSQP